MLTQPIRSGLVPICFTILPFATFIGTRGLEHCQISHRTLFGKLFHPKFWLERWCCRWWPLPICCTILLFATFIDTWGLGHFLESHRSPSNPNFWHECWSCSRSPIGKTIILNQIFFGPKFFLGPKIFWTKNFLLT